MKEPLTKRYQFVSRLEARHQEALEALFYFNDNQARISGALRHAVERYGSPQIQLEGEYLALRLSSVPQVQALFVMTPEDPVTLAGVVVYAREGVLLRVAYVGLAPAHAFTAAKQNFLLLEIFETLRQVGRRIRGVEAVEFTTGRRNLRLSLSAADPR